MLAMRATITAWILIMAVAMPAAAGEPSSDTPLSVVSKAETRMREVLATVYVATRLCPGLGTFYQTRRMPFLIANIKSWSEVPRDLVARNVESFEKDPGRSCKKAWLDYGDTGKNRGDAVLLYWIGESAGSPMIGLDF